ncbi:MAG TPA: Gfo/Idh/MocA family oxidoreductase [Conexibacter sp.]
MDDRIRIAVVGGGLIAQTVHVPTLAALPERFELVALADPSATVREALAARYPGLRTHADWRALIEDEQLDALVVCSPNGTHVDVTLAALDAGLHALVEKPLAIDPADAETIAARSEAAGRVVQVGYHKRYDAGYAALLDGLPDATEQLRLIDSVTYDPWMARAPFAHRDLVLGRDVPEALRRAGAEREREQVAAALGFEVEPVAVRAFVDAFLGALVHNVNLVHGVLERLGVTPPLQIASAGAWAEGKGANAIFRLAAGDGGAAWQSAWVLLEGMERYHERVSFHFRDAIHSLTFSSPYLREHATVHERVGAVDGAERAQRSERIVDHYRAELEHFHDCIVAGATCRTPPRQALLDLLALRDAFRAAVG